MHATMGMAPIQACPHLHMNASRKGQREDISDEASVESHPRQLGNESIPAFRTLISEYGSPSPRLMLWAPSQGPWFGELFVAGALEWPVWQQPLGMG